MGREVAKWVLWSGLLLAGAGAEETILQPDEIPGPTSLVGLAEGRFQDAQYVRAQIAANLFIQTYPDDPRVWRMHLLRAACLVRVGQYEEVVTSLEESARAIPELEDRHEFHELYGDALSSMPDRRFEAVEHYQVAGTMNEARQEFDRAGEVWSKLAALYMKYPGWPAEPGGAVPVTNQERNRVRRALVLEMLDRVTGLNTSALVYGKAQLLRGQILTEGGAGNSPDVKGALSAYDDALRVAGDTEVAADALYESAMLLVRHRSDYTEAVRRLETLIRVWGGSPRKQEAEKELKDIRRPVLSIFPDGVTAPGREPALRWRARNVRQLKLRIQRVELFELLREIGSPENLMKWEGAAEAVATWEAELGDDGSHRYFSSEDAGRSEIHVPLQAAGAYMVEAEAEGVKARTLLLISGIRAVAKDGKSGSLVWVTESASGKAVAGAEVLAQRAMGPAGFSYKQGKTDEKGIWEVQWQTRGGRAVSRSVTTLVRHGDDYAAVSQPYSWRWWGYPRSLRVYGFTDRPAYRAGQTVHFKQIIRSFRQGAYGNWAGRDVTVVIRDPQGASVYEATMKTNAMGCVSGHFALGAEPALGPYTIDVRIGDHTIGAPLSEGNRFRVVGGASRKAAEGGSVKETRSPSFTSADAERQTGKPGEPVRGDVELVPPKQTYEQGETVRVVVRSPHKDALVWVTAETDEVEFSRMVRIKDGAGEVEFDVTRALAPDFYLCATLVRDNEVLTDRLELFVPPTKPILHVSVDAGKGTFSPGEKVTIRIACRDSQGKGVAAEVVLFMVDTRVYEIQRPYRPRIDQFFYGDRRPPLVRTQTEHLHFGGGRPAAGDSETVNRSRAMAVSTATSGAKTVQAAKGKPVEAATGPAFSDAGLWKTHLRTNGEGVADVAVTMPNALAAWRVVAVAVDARTRAGEAGLEIVTK